MTYKAFRDVVKTGLRMGSWTAPQLFGDERQPEKVFDLMERVGLASYEKNLLRMEIEKELVRPARVKR